MVLAASVSKPKGHEREKYLAKQDASIYEDDTNVYDGTPYISAKTGRWRLARNRAREYIPSLKVFVCTLALALGLNNVFRFPREVSHYGGLPFLVAHLLLTIVISLPAVVLEVSLGLFCEKGVTKLWRAVPAFRGLAYIKLCASFICAAYTFIYISLSTILLIRIIKGPVPFAECRELKIRETGYKVNATDGLECVRNTLLTPVLENPTNYGVNACIIFVLWLALAACLYKKEKSLRPSIQILALAIIVCGLVASIITGPSKDIKLLFTNSQWDMLVHPSLWHAALIQSFFSLHLGFGYLVTSSSTIYDNNNPITTSVIYVATNVLIGWLNVFLWYKHMEGIETSVIDILIVVYDKAVAMGGSMLGPSFGFGLFILAGTITILALLFPIYNSIWADITCTWKVFATASTSVTVGVILSLLIFTQGLQVVIMLDEFVLPALLCFILFMETLSFAYIYGHKNVYNVIEFLLGKTITSVWKISWCITPFVILGLAVWRVGRCSIDGWFWQLEEWQLWLMTSILIAALLIFLLTAIWVAYHQLEYDILPKIRSSLKPSNKWGPADSLRRYGWLQWMSSENKDFTLRRKGTREYIASARIAGTNKRVAKGRTDLDHHNYGTYSAHDQNHPNNRHHILDVVSRSPHLQTAVITNNANIHVITNSDIPVDQTSWVYFHKENKLAGLDNIDSGSIGDEKTTIF